jgi:hypothetical protein
VPFFATAGWTLNFMQKFVNMWTLEDQVGADVLVVEFSSYMALFLIYFQLFNSHFMITQYFMIPAFSISYGIVAIN